MVVTCWLVGREIVEHEQGCKKRAAYGEMVLVDLSQRLAVKFGRGFDVTNLRKMRQFYRMFEVETVKRDAVRLVSGVEAVRHAVCAGLSWSHYRLLASRKKAPVRKEAKAKLATVVPEEFIRDPYVLDFLGLKDYPALRESAVEQAIIDNLQEFLLELGKGFSFVARQKRLRFEDEGASY